MARRAWWIAVLLVFAGCGGPATDTEEARLRAVIDAFTKAAVDRDYEEMWEYLDSGSKAAVEKQLHDVQALDAQSGLGRAMWDQMRRTFDLGPGDVAGLDARAYFVAMFRGMDRANPELRNRQVAATRDRMLVAVEMHGATASAVYREREGTEQRYDAVCEVGAWKLKADVAGGVRTSSR